MNQDVNAETLSLKFKSKVITVTSLNSHPDVYTELLLLNAKSHMDCKISASWISGSTRLFYLMYFPNCSMNVWVRTKFPTVGGYSNALSLRRVRLSSVLLSVLRSLSKALLFHTLSLSQTLLNPTTLLIDPRCSRLKLLLLQRTKFISQWTTGTEQLRSVSLSKVILWRVLTRTGCSYPNLESFNISPPDQLSP